MTPTCPKCGDKFPGAPCKKCPANAAHKKRMPSATRKRNSHGRRGA